MQGRPHQTPTAMMSDPNESERNAPPGGPYPRPFEGRVELASADRRGDVVQVREQPASQIRSRREVSVTGRLAAQGPEPWRASFMTARDSQPPVDRRPWPTG